jgi:hypothetical protein
MVWGGLLTAVVGVGLTVLLFEFADMVMVLPIALVVAASSSAERALSG